MFKRILIANRGEIVSRIIRTLNKMGIESVVVYSEADKDFDYVKEATISLCIGPFKSAESYLSHDAILEAARQSQAQAIHPGFGFLSENALFARRCQMQKITFIGPSPKLISMMGDKNRARETMSTLGIDIMPGSNVVHSPKEALERALAIGFPVLLKAKSGGGGKGMRLVENESQMEEFFMAAQKEALASFNDADLYMEKFIKNARHIEFQILADNFSNVMCFGNRDCSIQRNNQKLIEEAPAINFSDKKNQETQNKIIDAIKKIGYSNAGTMEFLLDEQENIYFMEMNTRIQVEHPVTELIYGIDLIEWQIRIAANQKLSHNLFELKPKGHAIECRINAEDPKENFKPSTGKVEKLLFPKNDPKGPLRIDTHISKNNTISPFYDSMLAKVITYGQTRLDAVNLMQKTLQEVSIEGLHTTKEFHQKILEDKNFKNGNYTCAFIKNMKI